LRNFDSILRPFFVFALAVQLNCNTRGSFSCISCNVFKRSNNTIVLFTLHQHQTNQLTQIYLISLPSASSLHKFNIHGFQYSRFSINTHGFLLYFQRLRLHQLAQIYLHFTHGSSLHKFNIHGFQYSRFLLFFQRLQSLKQHHASSDCISTRQIIKIFYPRLLHCTSSISTVSPPASQNISNASINSTALFQTVPWIKTEIISLHPMEHNSQSIRLSPRFQNFTASLNSFHDFFNSYPHPTDSFFFLSAALIFVKNLFTPNGTQLSINPTFLRFQFTASLNSFHGFFNSDPHPTDSFFFLSAPLIFVKNLFHDLLC
jgi:hypothetical protein